MVVGAVGIEIIKYLQGLEGNTFKNLTANLALPLWVFNDIIEPIVYKDSDNDPLLFCPVKAVPKGTFNLTQPLLNGINYISKDLYQLNN